MSARISGAMVCACCGVPESTSGCVRGPRCSCDSRFKCEVCKHCPDHHVKGCTEAVRLEAIRLIAGLRLKHHINIFDYGESKGRPWKNREFGERR